MNMTDNNKFQIITVLLILTFVTACHNNPTRKVSPHAMIEDISKVDEGRDAMLWYQGSDNEFDYFWFVSDSSAKKFFKVPTEQFVIIDKIAYTDDERNWIRIMEIGELWHSTISKSEYECKPQRFGTGKNCREVKFWRVPDERGIGINIKK